MTDWTNVGRDIALKLADKIPEVGSLVAFILGKVWPSNEPSIWDQISGQVKSLVDQEIVDLEMSLNRASINSLKDSLDDYNNAIGTQRGPALQTAIGKAEGIYETLTCSTNNIQFIPMVVTVSHLHLGLLAEQEAHGKEIFGEGENPKWKQELTDWSGKYTDFFRGIYPQWLTWRQSKITTDHGKTYNPPLGFTSWSKASDSLSGDTINYEEGMDSADDFGAAAEAAALRMKNRAIADMAGALASSFLINVYDPKTRNDPPIVDPTLAVLTLGPFCSASLGLDRRGNVSINNTDAPYGQVTSITVREYNAIDGFQLHYLGRDGYFCGSRTGGEPHEPGPGTGVHMTGICGGFAKGLMFWVNIYFSDGGNSGVLGNRAGWSGTSFNAVFDSAYEIVSAGYAEGSGPGGTSGVGLIMLTARHASLRGQTVTNE